MRIARNNSGADLLDFTVGLSKKEFEEALNHCIKTINDKRKTCKKRLEEIDEETDEEAYETYMQDLDLYDMGDKETYTDEDGIEIEEQAIFDNGKKLIFIKYTAPEGRYFK